MAAHTLGNPFPLDEVAAIAEGHGLWLVEDNCDALGSTYHGRLTGSVGDFGTLSFYPAHHITMGEGGAALTNRPQLKLLGESFRDWGRDCWCEPGEDNTCRTRFDWQLGTLPRGYDNKYIFSHVGYNLKVTDMQAAVGLAQLVKLDLFIAARRRNWELLRDGRFMRDELVRHLESRNIATRLLLGGNLTRQPAFQEVEFRAVGDLPMSDVVMERSLWIGPA